MYRGFKLELPQLTFENFKGVGQRLFDADKAKLKPILDKFILQNGVIDGSKMQENWFPQLAADIFISHSHKDHDQAVALAGWLHHQFNLKAFVDSSIWSYADDLLWQLDNKYCLNEDTTTFSYESRNHSTTHVHMMLQNALSKMIDNSECLFFLNTPSSTVSSIIGSKTSSAWIYSEIALTAIIEKKLPVRASIEITKGFSDQKRILLESIFPDISYKVDLSHLTTLTVAKLNQWDDNWNELSSSREGNALDKLYKQFPAKKI